MFGNKETTFFTHRHTKKSSEYPSGITPEGEDIVKQKTKESLLDTLEQADPGTILAMIGSSDSIRTKSTSRISGQELKELLAEKTDEYLVLDENDINGLVQNKQTESTIHKLQETVADNADKKIVINYPLALKQLSLIQGEATRVENKPEWKFDKKGEKLNPYTAELLKRNNNDDFNSVIDWIRNEGKIETADGKVLEGPNPQEVVGEYITSLNRLQETCEKLFPGRPLIIQETGHSWDIDVFIAYLTHEGKLDEKAFVDIATTNNEKGTIISEFESPIIKVSKDKASIVYRGKTWDFSPDLLTPEK
jgi:hypothetical protein